MRYGIKSIIGFLYKNKISKKEKQKTRLKTPTVDFGARTLETDLDVESSVTLSFLIWKVKRIPS